MIVVSSTKLLFFFCFCSSFDVTALLDFSYACTFTAVRGLLDNVIRHCCSFLFYVWIMGHLHLSPFAKAYKHY